MTLLLFIGGSGGIVTPPEPQTPDTVLLFRESSVLKRAEPSYTLTGSEHSIYHKET